MNELDDIARRSSAKVHDQAARIAGTEEALQEMRTGGPGPLTTAPTTTPAGSRRWITIGIAAAVVGAIVAGTIVLFNRDDRHSIVTSVPSVDGTEAPVSEPAPVATDAPATTTTTPPATTTTGPLVAAPAHRLDPSVDHGLSSAISADFPRIIRQDYLLPNATDRADYQLTIWLPSNAVVRVNLGHDSDRYANRQPTTIAGAEGWEAAGDPYSDVAFAVSRRLDDTTWLRVESLRNVLGDPVPVAPSLGDMRALAAAFEHDATLDDRVEIVTAEPTYAQPEPCNDGVSVNGGGPDMVLFLCDGRLGVFSGEDGKMIELIQQFDDQRGEAPSEGPGAPYVDGIAASSDGQTIYFSVGPEPAVGTTYRYVRGSGVAPEMIGYGHSPSVAPGPGGVQLVATIALDDILVIDPVSPEKSHSLTNISINPQSTPSWSPDGTRLAFEVGRGVVAMAEFTGARDGETRLYASDEPGRWFVEPWMTADGLLADSYCCDDPSGPVALVALGPPGNQAATVIDDSRPLDGDPVDGTIGLGGVWATGVITWAAIN